MVGGTVIEICDVPGRNDILYIDCANQAYSKIERCAIYVEKNPNSNKIEIGDAVWWQGRHAMWTPQKNRNHNEDLKCGVDYDIRIPRVGYSGV